MVALAVERFGRLDVLISNAGRALAERSHPQPGHRGLGAGVPDQSPRGRSTASVPRWPSCARSTRVRSCSPRRWPGLTAWSHAAPYCATKAAVIQLAKVAAVEYARDGIRVNCVCPGTFRSAIHDDLPPRGARRHRRAASPRARLGRRPGRRLLLSGRATRRAGRPARRSSSTAGTRRREPVYPCPSGWRCPRMKISANGFATSRADSGPPAFSHR